MILRILNAAVTGPHRLKLSFNNGLEKQVDIRPLLHGPVFVPVLNPDFFARVALDSVCGTIVWPNGADLAPEALLALPSIRTVDAA